MKITTLLTLSVTSAVAILLIAASPAWANNEHERHYGYGERYEHRHGHTYRPVIVRPVIRYGYAPAPVYYLPPRAYVPAPVHHRHPARIHHWDGRR